MTHLGRLSWFNRITSLLFLGGGILALAQRQWNLAVVLLVFLPVSIWLALRSQRGRGSDRDRVGAVQPFDERDSAVITRGFAFVGQTILLLQMAVAIWAMAMRWDSARTELFRFVVIAGALGIGNWIALKKS